MSLAGETKRFPRLPLGASSVFVGCISLTSLVLVRLIAFSHFTGSPFDLDFGMQWDARKGLRPSVAMKPGIFTFGHAAQGMLAYFLFPSVEYTLAEAYAGLAILGRIVSLFVVVYPLYNLKKRLKKHGEYFALSSFFSNSADWATGFLLGIFLGLLNQESLDLPPGELSTRTKDAHMEGWEDVWDAFEWLRVVAGVLLVLATCLAAVQLWRTWDLRPEGLNDVTGARGVPGFEPIEAADDYSEDGE